MRKIDAIVIHCTAHRDTAYGIGVAQIRHDHINARGWSDIGYHYVVRRNGEIECGRMESVIGAHCQNGYNQRSIGVAWVGIETPSSQQREAMIKITRDLMLRYSIPVHMVFGHKEADPDCGKQCPCLDMISFRTEVSQ